MSVLGVHTAFIVVFPVMFVSGLSQLSVYPAFVGGFVGAVTACPCTTVCVPTVFVPFLKVTVYVFMS